jgi:CDP-paratose 2-epimerase
MTHHIAPAATVPDAATPNAEADPRPTLITGGAGFIGCNVAHRLLSDGRQVVVLDNLSRPEVSANLEWLRSMHRSRLRVVIDDIRNPAAVNAAVRGCGQVFHFAAQVAVTTSLVDPASDFDVNARGTLNVLEAVRRQDNPPGVVFTSTNKVYGGLDDVPLRLRDSRYEPLDESLRKTGVSESRPLDFHSPYGCSKGAADQYVRDYARCYGINTVVFRMSCIYGPRQFGTEDQGWVAHFLIQASKGEPIVLYGDGMQVRDILFIDDLVNAFLLARDNIGSLAGRAFNIGGGTASTTSLIELLDRIADLRGERLSLSFEDWRTGDQRYYVSDTRTFQAATGWRPKVEIEEGVERLYKWIQSAGIVPKIDAGRRRVKSSKANGSTAAHAPEGEGSRAISG